MVKEMSMEGWQHKERMKKIVFALTPKSGRVKGKRERERRDDRERERENRERKEREREREKRERGEDPLEGE
jgi:hypothetical protein